MRRFSVQLKAQIFCGLSCTLPTTGCAFAQSSTADQTRSNAFAEYAERATDAQSPIRPPDPRASQTASDETDPSDLLTLFPHSEPKAATDLGQGNIVLQWHPTFLVKYSGPNSLSAPAESATTHILTFLYRLRTNATTEVLQTLSVQPVVVSARLSACRLYQFGLGAHGASIRCQIRPILARLMLRQLFLSRRDSVEEERDPFTSLRLYRHGELNPRRKI